VQKVAKTSRISREKRFRFRSGIDIIGTTPKKKNMNDESLIR